MRSLAELQDIYLQSVGGNATFLLNVPPNADGLLAATDVARLREMGAWLLESFSHNLLANAMYQATSEDAGCAAGHASQGEGYWKAADEDANAALVAQAIAPISPRYAVLQENIRLGQRIERFALDASLNGEWCEIACGTVVGYKRILPIPAGVKSAAWRVRILESRMGATLQGFALY